jgi:6-phosphogluconolactonase
VTELERFPSAAVLSTVAAAEIADRIADATAEGRTAAFAAAGGRTPLGIYDRLSGQDLPWERVRVVLTDERWVAPGALDSNERMLRNALLRDRARGAALIPFERTAATPIEEGARAVDRALARLSAPLDVVLLGMGEDGHVASLFPDSPALDAGLDLHAPARCVPVPAAASRAPVQPRVSLTLRMLAEARRVILVFTGRAKRETFERALEGDEARAMPVRALLRHAGSLRLMWAP